MYPPHICDEKWVIIYFDKHGTDPPTDRRTDTPSYRDARTHLKRIFFISFRTSSYLKIHERVHTGFSVKCDYCDFRANTQAHVNTHMKKHLGMMHKCRYCDYACTQKCKLKVRKFPLRRFDVHIYCVYVFMHVCICLFLIFTYIPFPLLPFFLTFFLSFC